MCQFDQKNTVAAKHIFPDHPRCRAIDQVPVVDAVVAARIEIEQGMALIVGQLFARLDIHHRHGGHAHLVARIVEHGLDLVQRQRCKPFGHRKDRPDRHAHDLCFWIIAGKETRHLGDGGRIGHGFQLGDKFGSRHGANLMPA
nr:hypothetical protein [Asticcacaulis biprosthecium]